MANSERARDGTVDGGPDAARARAELDALQRRFRAIIQRTADGIVVVDGEGRIRFANKAAAGLFGRGADRLVGSPFGHALVSGENTEIDIVRQGGPVTAELRVMDTEWEGEPARIVSLRDITDRKKAEEQARRLLREQIARAEAEEAARRAEILSEAGRRLSSSLDLETTLQETVALVVDELADYCMLDLVEDGRSRRYVAARRDEEREAVRREADHFELDLEGGSPQAVAYRDRASRLVSPVTDDWLRSAATDDDHLALLRTLDPHSVVITPVSRGDQRVGVLTAACTRPDTGFDETHVSLLEEVGQRIALAIENARLYRDAQAANQAKTNFLAVMSHELRTPLSAIVGYADLLEGGVAGEASDKQVHFLGRIRASSNHLLQIIEEILAFSRTEAGEEEVRTEETTLGQLMDAVAAVAEPLARDGALEFRLDVEDRETRIRTDTRKIRQILLNLLSNAFKFTQEGSVRLTARARDGTLVFAVQDTGVGIPEDRQEEIFDRFWQVEDPMTRTRGGTGLGLTIGRSFAELLGGSLRVESTEGVGSTFTLEVPAIWSD